MESCGGLDECEEDAEKVEKCTVSTVDSQQILIQVIRAMRSEIRKLELENMGLRRRAGANLRKNATVPVITATYRESVVMTVRRYSVFQPLPTHQDLHLDNKKTEEKKGKQQK